MNNHPLLLKALVLAALALLTPAPSLLAQSTPANTPPAELSWSPYSETARGPHSRVLQRFASFIDSSGATNYLTNSYTELATALSFQSPSGNGDWLPASDQIQITSAGAAATNLQSPVALSGNLNSGGFAITLPDGRIISGAPLFLSYFDGDNIAVIADLRDSVGQLLPALNTAVFTNTFSNLQATVQYTVKIGGLEQFVVLNQCPPAPSEFGLGANGALVRLQAWTELSSCPTPQIQPSTNEASGLVDETLDFGTMNMGKGTAFLTENGTVLTPVYKHFTVIQNRVFLVEEVPLNSILPALQALPPYSSQSSGSLNPRSSAALLASAFVPPPRRSSARRNGPMLLAKSAPPLRGVSIDFALLNSTQTNFTFCADLTYFITNAVNLFGVTSVEGGTAVKFSTNSVASIVATNIVWNTSPWHMAAFTSQFDDTIGSQITGSTSNPTTNFCGGNALDVFSSTTSATISNARFSFLSNAIHGSQPMTVMNAQFNHCYSVLANESGSYHFLNVLCTQIGGLQNQPCIACDGVTIDAENVTIDNCSNFVANPTVSTINLTNCIFAAVTNFLGGTVTSNSSALLAGDSGVFQTVGAGNFYLAANSPYRGVGTSNLNSALLASLAQSTTFPPLLLTNTFTNNTVITAQAQRNASATPDIGYSYPAVDYLSSCAVSNATLLLTNSVVLAYYGYGIWVQNGGQLVSQGTPNQPNRLVYYNYAQEQATNLWSASYSAANAVLNSLPLNFYEASLAVSRNPWLRFTTLSGALGATYVWQTDGGDRIINFLTIKDCEIDGGGGEWYMVNDPAAAVITLENNFFPRAYVEISDYAWLNTYNCLYTGSNHSITISKKGTPTWVNKNNAFDAADIFSLDSTFNYDGFLNGTIHGTLRTGDMVTNLAWQSGFLGNYYQPTNSPLLNMGNTSAANLGLYHYTVTTNQVAETNSTVTIGLHYIALGANDLPLDTTGSGTPDYLKDANGNGLVDSGEINWLDPNDLGLVVLVTHPQNNSIIP